MWWSPAARCFWQWPVFLPAFAISFVYSVWKERRIAPMLGISGVTIGILGGLTLFLQNKTFFYMKPTVIYAMFAIALAGGLASGRIVLKTLLDGAIHMEDAPWKVLTIRFAWFYGALAVANEVIWRWLMRDCDVGAAAVCAGEPTWVNIKIWGFTVANFVFLAFQAPFFSKHVDLDGTNEAVSAKPSEIEREKTKAAPGQTASVNTSNTKEQ